MAAELRDALATLMAPWDKYREAICSLPSDLVRLLLLQLTEYPPQP